MLCTNAPVLLRGKPRALGEPLAPAQLLGLHRCTAVYEQSRAPHVPWEAAAALTLLGEGTGRAGVHRLAAGLRLAPSYELPEMSRRNQYVALPRICSPSPQCTPG